MPPSKNQALTEAESLLHKPVFSREDSARVRGLLDLADTVGSDSLIAAARAKAGSPAPASDPLNADFRRWLVSGQVTDRLQMQTRDLSGSGGSYPGSANGFFVPSNFDSSVKAMMKQVDRLFDPDVVTVVETPGGPYSIPNLNDVSTSAAVVAQGSQSVIAEPLLGLVTFGTAPTWRSGAVRVSIELVQDSAVSWDQLLARLFAIRFVRGLGPSNVSTLLSAAAVGVGPSTTPAITGDDNSASPSSSSQVGYGDIQNLVNSLDVAYLASPKTYWAMSLRTAVSLWSLRSKQGNPMIPAQFNAKGEPIIFGIPVAISPSMPSIGPGNSPIALGDFSYLHVREVRNSMKVYRFDERYIEYAQVLFESYTRGQAALHLTPGADSPIKVISNHA